MAAIPAQAATRVYLMRGLFDASTGLDALAAKLKRHGISAQVAGYAAQSEFATAAIQGHARGTACPIIIIGHSLGADAAVDMAEALNSAHVPVALLVAFSSAQPKSVPANVQRVVNYFQSNSAFNTPYSRGPGFHGALRNVNLASSENIDHFNIEKVVSLHEQVIHLVQSTRGACGH
jgi:thioesterase domain-containing protein